MFGSLVITHYTEDHIPNYMLSTPIIMETGIGRYYMDVPAGGGRQGDDTAAMEGAAPGVLGLELLEALGLVALDPPPWLGAMLQLGVPPGACVP